MKFKTLEDLTKLFLKQARNELDDRQCQLLSYYIEHSQNGICERTHETIKSELDFSDKATRRYREHLKSCGYITVIDTSPKKVKVNFVALYERAIHD